MGLYVVFFFISFILRVDFCGVSSVGNGCGSVLRFFYYRFVVKMLVLFKNVFDKVVIMINLIKFWFMSICFFNIL